MNPLSRSPMTRSQVAMQHAVSVGQQLASAAEPVPPEPGQPTPAGTQLAAGPPARAPWHCAEWCAQKWSQPGTFPEYQNCLDTCRQKWPQRFTSLLPPVDPATGGIPKLPAGCCVDMASKRLVCPNSPLDGLAVILHAATGSVWVDGTRLIVVELGGKGYWAPVCSVQLADKPRPVHPFPSQCAKDSECNELCGGTGGVCTSGTCQCIGLTAPRPSAAPATPAQLATRSFRYLSGAAA